MKCPRFILFLTLGLVLAAGASRAQQRPETEWDIRPLNPPQGEIVSYLTNGYVVAKGGVMVRFAGIVLTADEAGIDPSSGEVNADGNVRIQQGEQLWVSEHIRYNFNTHQMEARQFRTGQNPIFASGEQLHAEATNQVHGATNLVVTLAATNAIVTADDVASPLYRVKARRIKIIPGKRIEAYDAVLYLGEVPVFYLPYFSRSLTERANNFNFTPGYRSKFGPFILGRYNWWWGDEFDGTFHLDYREKRGPGVGPDVNYHLGEWGEGTFKYYYTHDKDPNIDDLGVPIGENRQRVWFSYESNPATNLYIKSLVRYQSDLAVVRDFFEGEYRLNSQPDSYFDVNRFWQNFSVDAFVQPRLNTFLETVERLPDIRITGYRQELGNSPLYYESQSSAGYYRFLYAENSGVGGAPPGLNYEAGRADTFQQLLLPETFFGWLNVTPRAGGRLTYYSQASGPGATTEEVTRGVFNTGAEVSFKASRVWPTVQSQVFDVDGVRHIIEPSANYVFVPNPSAAPPQLPQFDTELPSLRLLPIDFPDYNAIDSIDSQNVIRWGLVNKLQTKRDGKVANLVNWNVYTDWRIKPNSNETKWADLFSDLTFRPRSWLTFESLLRYDLTDNDWRMSYNTLTIQPNTFWTWRIGHYYLANDYTAPPPPLGQGNNVWNNIMYFRLNEEWGFRMGHYFNAQTGQLQEQTYSVYKDMRSWTAALSFFNRHNTTGPQDYGVAFTFSLKAYPRFGVGGDTVGPYSLLGG
jgi:LPS-assembly protein